MILSCLQHSTLNPLLSNKRGLDMSLCSHMDVDTAPGKCACSRASVCTLKCTSFSRNRAVFSSSASCCSPSTQLNSPLSGLRRWRENNSSCYYERVEARDPEPEPVLKYRKKNFCSGKSCRIHLTWLQNREGSSGWPLKGHCILILIPK